MPTILVCDDDKQIVEAINIYLTGEGFNVIKAYDGYEALELLEKNEVNLMIVDVMMPGCLLYTSSIVTTRGQPIGQPIHVNLLSSIVYASSILTVIVSRSGYFKRSAFLNFSSSISPGATTGRFLWITRSSPKYALT